MTATSYGRTEIARKKNDCECDTSAVGKMIAQLRQARDLFPESSRGEKDAEGGWRHRAEEVRLITNKWKSSFVVGKMVDGEWHEVPEENLRSAMGCEWFTRLGEVRAMEAGN